MERDKWPHLGLVYCNQFGLREHGFIIHMTTDRQFLKVVFIINTLYFGDHKSICLFRYILNWSVIRKAAFKNSYHWIYPYILINPIFFLLFATVKYNTVIYKNNVIIILWFSFIIFKNLQLEYSPLLILMTTENIIDTMWQSIDLQRYCFSVNTKTNYFICRVCSIYKCLFTFACWWWN